MAKDADNNEAPEIITQNTVICLWTCISADKSVITTERKKNFIVIIIQGDKKYSVDVSDGILRRDILPLLSHQRVMLSSHLWCCITPDQQSNRTDLATPLVPSSNTEPQAVYIRSLNSSEWWSIRHWASDRNEINVASTWTYYACYLLLYHILEPITHVTYYCIIYLNLLHMLLTIVASTWTCMYYTCYLLM